MTPKEGKRKRTGVGRPREAVNIEEGKEEGKRNSRKGKRTLDRRRRGKSFRAKRKNARKKAYGDGERKISCRYGTKRGNRQARCPGAR